MVKLHELTPCASSTAGSALRDQLVEDGYLFLRGVLDPADVLTLRRCVLDALAGVGWLEDGSDPAEARPGTQPHRFGSDDWWPGYVALQALEEFHRLAHHPSLTALMGAVLDGEPVVHPHKVIRVKYPSIDNPTPPHQDYYFIRGTSDTITSWVPLGDAARQTGGLAVVPGSHRAGMRPVVPASGEGGISVEPTPAESERWATADFRAGDVVVFHSLLVHQGTNNGSDRLRLSVDYRYSRDDEPVVAESLQPHAMQLGHVPGWGMLTRGWSSKHWVSVPPLPIEVPDYGSTTAPPSRLLGSIAKATSPSS